LAAVYDSSTERGRIAFGEGEAGIGKSRLADELAALVNAHGGRVIATRGYRGESSLAYAPISDALSRAATGDAAWPASLPPRTVANVAQLVPEIGRGLDVTPQPAELDEEAARSRFLADLARCLEAALAGSPPGLLLVDDGQWLDDASVAVLAHLVRRIADLRMCIIVCERSDELVGDRLEGLKRDARRGGVLDEFVLERLGPDDVRSLASASGLAPDLGQALFERSEGIPFFVVEYLELLRTGDGTSADAERLPQGIRDLVASRLEMVSAEAGQVLTSAAVIGRSFDGSLVRRASGRSADETVRALEELLRLGLVRERAASGDYDFDHEVTRDVLLAETSLARRRLLHRRIAEVLRERPSARSGQAAQIASHYAAAGDEREAAMYLRRAGKEAERLFANREALEHYAAALALDSTDATELHQRIGDLETLLGRYADAVASYESAAALAPPADLGQIEHQLAKVHHRRGEWALAETHYLAALSALPRTDANQRARVYADRSLTAHRRGDPDAARAFAGEALDLASAAGDSATLAQVHNLLGILAKAAGALDEARAQLEQSLERAVEHPGARIAAMNNLALVERAAEQPERAVELTRAALRLCVTLGDRHREAALRNNLADLLHAAGRADEAMAELRESVTIFTEIGEPGTMQPEIWKLVEW
jgi:predicted ATPase